jgi:site-specific recombinase XerD
MNGRSKATVKGYCSYLNKFLAFVESNDLEIRSINARHIKMFRNYWIEQGLKPVTVNGIISAVKNYFDFLVEEGILDGNPIVLKRLRIKVDKPLPAFMTPEELVFSNWLTTTPRNVALGFRTMLATGMRVSEVSSFSSRDVIEMSNGGYVIRVRHGKGDKERYVPIMEAKVLEDLLEFKAGRAEDLPFLGVTISSLAGWARRCRMETGLNFYSHRCRHTVGTQLLQRGVPIDRVQDVLGHADISTTRRYAKTAPEAVLKLAAKLDSLEEERAVYTYVLPDMLMKVPTSLLRYMALKK